MDNNKKEIDQNDRIVGRVDKPGENYKEEQNKADISHVDRQEGTMNHGTKGGNFDDNEPSETKRSGK
jgi:hypothetical protein